MSGAAKYDDEIKYETIVPAALTKKLKASTQNITGQLLRLPLRFEEMYVFMQEADRAGMELEEYLARQLRDYGRTKTGSYIVNPDERREIEQILGINLGISTTSLSRHIKLLAVCGLQGTAVLFPVDVIKRLRSRCIGKQDFKVWLEKTVIQQMKNYVGM
ncbi:MAG TPA: hypothetical protein VKQ11_00520 [Candidatus Sulfotelmatobacter sp.]|nr:hypothetical protein [Candidatus Sulfotelmatobacter sp.]